MTVHSIQDLLRPLAPEELADGTQVNAEKCTVTIFAGTNGNRFFAGNFQAPDVPGEFR